jgi:predicted TIM-barrel fold metal-dependent hydrolase
LGSDFDIFHAGYPFTSEVGVLAKMFPGVYADMCWMHIISPSVARRTLDEWIETVPASKIFGFGGDYLFAEGAYAHSMLARENIARVLASKIADGYITGSEALRIAQMILHDNAQEFFKL